MAANGPSLKSHVRLLERSDSELQLRLAGGVDLVVTPATAATRAVLGALDGRHSLEQLRVIGRCAGGDADEVDDLLTELTAQGLVVHPGESGPLVPALSISADEDDAEVRAWSERGLDVADAARRTHRLSAARLVLHGRGPLVDAVRAQLDPRLQDVSCTGGDTSVFDHPVRTDLVVVLAADALDPVPVPAAFPTRALLPVIATWSSVAIGPMFAARTDPCPRCLDQYRCDRDPAWPRVLAQLTRSAPDGLPAPCRTERQVAAMAASAIARIAHNHMLGWRPPPGITFEVGGLWPQITYRRWPVHPGCPAHQPSSGEPAIMAG